MITCAGCGLELTARASILLGYGPKCAARLGITLADALPQRCSCCIYSQAALHLLWGVGPVVPVVRHDGSRGWVEIGTGVLIVERSEPDPFCQGPAPALGDGVVGAGPAS